MLTSLCCWRCGRWRIRTADPLLVRQTLWTSWAKRPCNFPWNVFVSVWTFRNFCAVCIFTYSQLLGFRLSIALSRGSRFFWKTVQKYGLFLIWQNVCMIFLKTFLWCTSGLWLSCDVEGLVIAGNTFHGVGGGDGGQASAIIEAIVSHTRYGVGDGDGGQARAIIEAIVSQTRYLVSIVS